MAKSHFFGMLTGALLLASPAAHAATTTFNLDNVTFGIDGTITGFFTFDGTNLTNVSVTVSSASEAGFDTTLTAGSLLSQSGGGR
jgi:hypothetical protein